MRLKKYFITGLVVWIPILITALVIKFIMTSINQVIHLIPQQYQLDYLIGMHLPGSDLIILVCIIFFTGLISAHWFAKKIGVWTEKGLNKIPLIRSIYSGSKQSIKALFSKKNQSFKQVLLVEYPGKDIWSIGFLTNKEPTLIKDKKNNMVLVFIPTTPNPTSGMLVLVPKTKIIEINLSIEQALKMIISLGTLNIKNTYAHKKNTKKTN